MKCSPLVNKDGPSCYSRETLIHLRDQGNTVLVVEHDQETMESADHLVDKKIGAHFR